MFPNPLFHSSIPTPPHHPSPLRGTSFAAGPKGGGAEGGWPPNIFQWGFSETIESSGNGKPTPLPLPPFQTPKTMNPSGSGDLTNPENCSKREFGVWKLGSAGGGEMTGDRMVW